MAALEPGRVSLQVLHEDDPCCFRGRGRHAGIIAYDAHVNAVLAKHTKSSGGDPLQGGGSGVFSTSISDWNRHEVCPRDRAIIEAALRRARASTSPSLLGLPCDILNGANTTCSLPPPPSPPPRPPHPSPPSPPPPLTHGPCWRGAHPPCIFAATSSFSMQDNSARFTLDARVSGSNRRAMWSLIAVNDSSGKSKSRASVTDGSDSSPNSERLYEIQLLNDTHLPKRCLVLVQPIETHATFTLGTCASSSASSSAIEGINSSSSTGSHSSSGNLSLFVFDSLQPGADPSKGAPSLVWPAAATGSTGSHNRAAANLDKSTVGKYCMNVGLPLARPDAELQLYSQCSPAQSNEVFRYNPSDSTLSSVDGRVVVAACLEGGDDGCQ